ncbi:MAG: hypothetical protein M1536_05935 [Firmicutes bacterium]|nr:hypothetical protein [Bacillota bacterium]
MKMPGITRHLTARDIYYSQNNSGLSISLYYFFGKPLSNLFITTIAKM